MAQTVPATVVLGPGMTGLAIGYRILTLARATHSAFTTTNVAETSTAGTYAVTGGVSAPDAGGYIVWGVSGTDYAEGNIDPVITASDIATSVWASGTRTLTSFGTLVADIWANVTRTLTSGGGASAADIWAYASRTLTQTAAEVQAAVSGSDLTVTRAVTFSATLTGLTVPSGWDKIYFTVKKYASDSDANAYVQIVVSDPSAGSDGLLRINKAAGTANQGSLVVDEEEDTIAISIADDATALLTTSLTGNYDIKAIVDGASVLLTAGSVRITNTPTQAIA